jgi:hypothetical protein
VITGDDDARSCCGATAQHSASSWNVITPGGWAAESTSIAISLSSPGAQRMRTVATARVALHSSSVELRSSATSPKRLKSSK